MYIQFKKSKESLKLVDQNGGAEGDRTLDLLTASNVMLVT